MNPCAHCKKLFKKAYSKQKFCSISCSNRNHLNNKRIFIFPKKPCVETAELFGILLGDGSITKYFTKIYLNRVADQGYSKNILRLMSVSLPGAMVVVRQVPSRGLEELQISSKDVCDYLRSIGFDPKKRGIPRWILDNPEFIKATIRGLFDTEGCIGIKKFQGKKGIYVYHQLTFTNINVRLLRFVEKQLTLLDFKPTKNSKKNIYLSNRQDIARYFKVIGTSNPKLEKKLLLG